MENIKTRFVITKVEDFREFVEIGDLFGSGCNYPTGRAVNDYQVDFDVTDIVENINWHFTFQSDDRNDNLKAYYGYEMRGAKIFGCDIDESYDFVEYYDFSDEAEEAEEFVQKCLDLAEDKCCTILKNSEYID